MIELDQFEVLTFDCYGTLIDWETGIWEALRPVLAAHQVDLPPKQALELYGELESAAEAGFGATPPAQAQPDLETPDLQSLARLAGLL